MSSIGNRWVSAFSAQSVVMLRLLCTSTPPGLSRAPPFRHPHGCPCRSLWIESLFFLFPHGRIPPGCRSGEPSLTVCSFAACNVRSTHPWPQQRIAGHFCCSRGGAHTVRCRRQCPCPCGTVSEWRWIWAPAAVCMASGRWARIVGLCCYL